MEQSRFIPLMVPDISEDDIQAVVNVLRSGMLVQGVNVEKLEHNIASYLGVKHAVAVSSGTASLHIALIALGIGTGDEVIVPAFSFMATANVIEIVGAKPVFVDIDIKTFNIDVNLIEQAITSKTKAIMPVHEFGLACDITEICAIAKKHKLAVIEDAACALGATENGKFAGTFGDIGSFSFHPRKAMTSGEGGLLITQDDLLANRFRVLRNHGISITEAKTQFVDAGFNYRMTDFQAALLCSQFDRYTITLEYKDILAQQYFAGLGQCSQIVLPYVPKNKKHSWQSFHTVLNENINRETLITTLFQKGVGSNIGAQCIPMQKYYYDKYKINSIELFPNALQSYEFGLVLPLYSKLKEYTVMQITSIVIDSISSCVI